MDAFSISMSPPRHPLMWIAGARRSLNTHAVAQLQRLVGQPLWGAERALNLHTLQLGEHVVQKRRDGREVQVGRHALHLQCAWRILANGNLLVGSRDRTTPRGNPRQKPDNFNWDEPGSTLCDEKLEALFKLHALDPLTVTAVVVGECGAFRMDFTKGYALEVFPDDSVDEQWRYFDWQTKEAEGHFVFKSTPGEGSQ